MRVKFRRALSGCAAMTLLLTGCAALPGFGPAPLDTFELTAPASVPQGKRVSRKQVLIAEPSALKALDSDNIVIQPAAGSIQFLKGAQWSDRLTSIVQARLAEAFQRSGRFGGVGTPGEGLAIDYQIVSDIREFGIRLDQPDRAVIEIYVRVLDDRNGVVRASRDFKVTAPVDGTGDRAFVAALDHAFGTVALQIVDWSVSVM